ncbi:DUF559 domain-containing protein [Gordonia sp. NPDC003950]
MSLPSALRVLALEHDGVLTARDFRKDGLDRAAVHRLVRTGDLIVVARGVHRVSTYPMTMRTRIRMTTHRAGVRAIVSGHAAAWWWDAIDTPPSTITVTVPLGHRCAIPGATIRHRRLNSKDVTQHCGLAVTGLALSVLEAGVESGIELVDAALLHNKVTEDALRAAYDRRRGCEDAAAMGMLLDGIGSGARSVAEREAVRLLRAAGIEGWIANHPVPPYKIDFAFVAKRVAVEIDGMAFHRDAHAFQRDRRRRNDLIAAGWNVLNFTWADIVERPEYVIARIRQALADAK